MHARNRRQRCIPGRRGGPSWVAGLQRAHERKLLANCCKDRKTHNRTTGQQDLFQLAPRLFQLVSRRRPFAFPRPRRFAVAGHLRPAPARSSPRLRGGSGRHALPKLRECSGNRFRVQTLRWPTTSSAMQAPGIGRARCWPSNVALASSSHRFPKPTIIILVNPVVAKPTAQWSQNRQPMGFAIP
jgi:hypothetical protein